MPSLTSRPYAGEADVQPIVDLINTCEAIDRLDQGVSVAEHRHNLADPDLDPAHNVRLWHAADGALVGVGVLRDLAIGPDRVEGRRNLTVLPAFRGEGLGEIIAAWCEGRLREIGRQHGKPATLWAGARDDDAYRRPLTERAGYYPARYFLTLQCPLDADIPEPVFPAGYWVRPSTGRDEAEQWTALFNESFIDHWNHHDLTVEQVNHGLTQPAYRAELDLVGVAPDGTLAAFCFCEVNPAEIERTGRNEGWIHLLGSRRGHRRLGLGRAMLLAGLRTLRGAGVAAARLGVDSVNPSGATRLYESVGFRTVATWIVYEKDVTHAAG